MTDQPIVLAAEPVKTPAGEDKCAKAYIAKLKDSLTKNQSTYDLHATLTGRRSSRRPLQIIKSS
jgi:hypothetical protein